MLYSNVALLWSIFCWCHGLVLMQDVIASLGRFGLFMPIQLWVTLIQNSSFDIINLQIIMYDVSVKPLVK